MKINSRKLKKIFPHARLAPDCAERDSLSCYRLLDARNCTLWVDVKKKNLLVTIVNLDGLNHFESVQTVEEILPVFVAWKLEGKK